MFKLPLNMTKNDLTVAKLIEECKLIVSEKCTMVHKNAIEALSHSFIDFTGKIYTTGQITIVVFMLYNSFMNDLISSTVMKIKNCYFIILY